MTKKFREFMKQKHSEYNTKNAAENDRIAKVIRARKEASAKATKDGVPHEHEKQGNTPGYSRGD